MKFKVAKAMGVSRTIDLRNKVEWHHFFHWIDLQSKEKKQSQNSNLCQWLSDPCQRYNYIGDSWRTYYCHQVLIKCSGF